MTLPERADPSWALGPLVPQTHRPTLRALGRWMLRVAGWQFAGAIPNIPRVVVIVAPHTSNWDFIIGLSAKWALGLDAHWWGKDTLFRPPLDWFMRANGGIPVDRHNKQNVVQHTIALMQSKPQCALALSPEGTRQRVQEWRSGFWHVAKGAGVPICCVAFDWQHRTIRLGPVLTPDEDDPAEGIARVRQAFGDVQGYDRTQRINP